jgi:hypothetical protein
MKIRGKPITIGSDLLNHLFVNVPCPKCNVTGLISLDMMHKQFVQCPQCRSKLRFDLYFDELLSFANAFDQLYARLQRVGLPLLFFPEGAATIWSQDSNP